MVGFLSTSKSHRSVYVPRRYPTGRYEIIPKPERLLQAHYSQSYGSTNKHRNLRKQVIHRYQRSLKLGRLIFTDLLWDGSALNLSQISRWICDRYQASILGIQGMWYAYITAHQKAFSSVRVNAYTGVYWIVALWVFDELAEVRILPGGE